MTATFKPVQCNLILLGLTNSSKSLFLFVLLPFDSVPLSAVGFVQSACSVYHRIRLMCQQLYCMCSKYRNKISRHVRTPGNTSLASAKTLAISLTMSWSNYWSQTWRRFIFLSEADNVCFESTKLLFHTCSKRYSESVCDKGKAFNDKTKFTTTVGGEELCTCINFQHVACSCVTTALSNTKDVSIHCDKVYATECKSFHECTHLHM